MKALTLFLAITCLIRTDPDKELVENYVSIYSDFAVIEMHRVGIPASIKLAQAILESKCGTSVLARRTKNHFGIKCKSYWKGKNFYYQDDDHDENNKPIESCFRVYPSVVLGFVDHSNFIAGSIDYAPLISKRITDFALWAKALQQNGYATDSRYARKLEKIIKKYNLKMYDSL